MAQTPTIRTVHAKLTEQELNTFQESLGLVSQVAGLRQIMLWFAEQPQEIRMEILSMWPTKLRARIARIILEDMAKDRPKR